MSWLSKGAKSVTNVVAPVVSGITGKATDWLFGGPKYSNPYDAPNLDVLNDTAKFQMLGDTSKFDFLKNPDQYKLLTDMTPYQGLNSAPTNPFAASITSKGKTFADTYKPPANTSDAMFQDLMNNINAPSSTDAVRKEMESERVKQLLEGIDTDTNSAMGSSTMDFADRGLNGPGMSSDIEAITKAQILGDAAKRKAEVRNTASQAELDRLKAREDAARSAYGKRYETGVATDSQGRQIAAQGATTDIGNWTDLLKTQAGMGESAADRSQKGQLALAELLSGGRKDYASAIAQGGQNWADIANKRDLSLADLLNSRDVNSAQILLDAYQNAAKLKEASRDPGFLGRIGNSFGDSFGKTLGEGAGKGIMSIFG